MTDDEFLQELEKCVRCGQCRAVCPVFFATLRETDVARGRLFAIDAFDSSPTKPYLDTLARCLLCGACEAKCQSGVPVPDLVRHARSHHSVSLIKRLVFDLVLASPDNLRRAKRAAHGLSAIFYKRLPENSGLRFRLGVFGPLDRKIPAIPKTDLFQTHGTMMQKSNIALFSGCVFSYLLPDVGADGLAVLKSAGVNADLPAGQSCCGLMAYGSGDDEAAKKAALAFVDVFAPYDTVLTLCASCSAMLSLHLKSVLPNDKTALPKVVDFFDYLEQIGYEPKSRASDRLSYHAPCHFRFTLKTDAAKRLLEKSGPLVDMENGCCGFGGSFSVAEARISREIGHRRGGEIEKSGAEVVATSCSGCALGLMDATRDFKHPPKIVHPVQIFAKEK